MVVVLGVEGDDCCVVGRRGQVLYKVSTDEALGHCSDGVRIHFSLLFKVYSFIIGIKGNKIQGYLKTKL